MQHKKFEKLLKVVIGRIPTTLASKSAEYSTDSDKLYNFKRSGERLRVTPERALMGMAEKHYTSITDIVDKIEAENQAVGLQRIIRPRFLTKKKLEEKITDGINYLILLEALIKERYGWI